MSHKADSSSLPVRGGEVPTVVGQVSEFRSGHPRVFEIGRRSLVVVQTKTGFFAFRNSCPHQAAPMSQGMIRGAMRPSSPLAYDYAFEDEVIRCPWHGYEFWLESGRSVSSLVSDRLVTYRVEVEGGNVLVWTKA